MLNELLKYYFNYTDFKPGQEDIIESIVSKKDAVVLMPTGGGKSLCYQLPALVNENLTIVISPLIALMKDQVDSLKLRGIEAGLINSSLNRVEIEGVLDKVRQRQIKILYLAPERLQDSRLQEILFRVEVGLIAIDEAHCVSSWGHDFRPDYMKLNGLIKRFNRRPTVATFTATATPEVRKDIIKHLGLVDPVVFVRGFDRPNLIFSAQNSLSDKQRSFEALKLIKAMTGSGIVYTLTRKKTEELAKFFNEHGVESVAYHAGLDLSVRTQVQNNFMENKYQVIVATIAFGMGVNKADVRFVIHLGMPASLENYYQEAGRAGRDGEPAECVLLASRRDFGLQTFFIQKSQEEMKEQGKSSVEIKEIINIRYHKLNQMWRYVDSEICRRKIMLEYFADPEIHKYNNNCQGCDVCLGKGKKRLRLDIDSDDDEFRRKGQDKEMEKLELMRSDKKYRVKLEMEKKLSNTVLESVKLYEEGYKAEAIAKLRGLGVGTIWGHLIRWYVVGGELEIDALITPEEEKSVLRAMAEADSYTKLTPIKEKLPENISYEQIKLVIAKIQRIRLG